MAVVVVVGAGTLAVVEVAAPHPVAAKTAVPMARTQSRFTSHDPLNLRPTRREGLTRQPEAGASSRPEERGPPGSGYMAGVVGVHGEARLRRPPRHAGVPFTSPSPRGGAEARGLLPHDPGVDDQTVGLTESRISASAISRRVTATQETSTHGVTWMTPFFQGCGVQWYGTSPAAVNVCVHLAPGFM